MYSVNVTILWRNNFTCSYNYRSKFNSGPRPTLRPALVQPYANANHPSIFLFLCFLDISGKLMFCNGISVNV